MARSIVFHHLTALKALTILFVLAVLVPNHVEGRLHWHGCPSFSCGNLRNVSSPFRQAGDPRWCGFQSYELVCNDTKATIHINNASYYVSRINHGEDGVISTFWVVDSVLDLHNQCPLPQWSRPFAQHKYGPDGLRLGDELALGTNNMASFVRCTHEVRNNGMYMPVTCLSTSYSFVYVLTGQDSDIVENLEPSCGYLAMTPLGSWDTPQPVNASYADTIEFMRNGFAVLFPLPGSITECLVESIRLVRYLNIYAVLIYYLMLIHFDLYLIPFLCTMVI
jgi:hypothetical protein